MAKVTLKEIARRAGVTANTVSRALNNRGGISKETQRRILKIAHEMNYIPDRIASSLRSMKSNLIGVMVPNVSTANWADILRGVEDCAYENGFQILLSNSQEERAREKAILEQFRSLRVQGLILMPSFESQELIRTIAGLPTPCVLINRRYMGYEIPFVMPDNVHGIRQAVAHLVNRGHERIGFVNGHPGSMTSQIRYNAFTESMRESGIDLAGCPAIMCKGSCASATEAARKLLEEHPQVTALMCFSDLIAFGAYKAIQEGGRKIPGDIAVVGFDDVDLATIVSPPLTTVHIPRYDMGKTAMRMLLKAMAGEKIEPLGQFMETRLVVRESA
ncbi:MAG TPA: LacI family DNA-binding transcriptional regulator [bacterium]|nr:LacI family DNA-binding transcriptional regulator [Candidatus Omnitrophota bacterium]HOJ61283.1 LacI family DNA-binding transcriptional regulator [bacterium]HOL93097.1 LacI family DNA-binding transcriptional regulator [bacterium]HPP02455.1 LacI family DNA-binding transcriptional regulator [bacterium]HXK94211.1 LacI family DNA-binding transcriptional regulator [bacterium]